MSHLRDIPSAKNYLINNIHNKDSFIYNSILGNLYEHLSNDNKALDYYQVAFEVDESNESNLKDYLRLLLKNNEYSKARKLLEKISTNDPLVQITKSLLNKNDIKLITKIKSKFELASIEKIIQNLHFYFARENYYSDNQEGTVFKLLIYLGIEPKDSDARFFLATAFLTSDRFEEGIRQLRRIKQKDPLYIQSRLFAVLVLKRNSKMKKAMELIAETYEAKPENSDVTLLYVNLLKLDRKFNKARKILEKSIERKPKNQKFLLEYAGVLYEQNLVKESIVATEKILKINPENSEALNFIAYSFAEKNINLEKAKEYVLKALEQEADNPYFLGHFSMGFFQAKRL